MRVDSGVALVVYRKSNGRKEEYLILKRDKNWTGWELPKGHLEFQSHKATVFVELNEETGIEPVEVKQIEETGNYLTFKFNESGEEIVSNFKVFKIRVDQGSRVSVSSNPSEEHDKYEWVSVKKAKNKLEYLEQKEIMRSLV